MSLVALLLLWFMTRRMSDDVGNSALCARALIETLILGLDISMGLRWTGSWNLKFDDLSVERSTRFVKSVFKTEVRIYGRIRGKDFRPRISAEID